jgi:poly(hydroxyalkanoate) depolymerase family esterase
LKPSPHLKSFAEGAYSNSHGTRRYKLFIPSHAEGKPLPLLVMLHGCLQDPDDFALGTRMNTIAEEQRIFVLYPEQSEAANKTRCWNWFNAANQRRDQGEPSIIAGMTREVTGCYNIDARRIYIAGMSAGGAMAAIMAATYPDLYAAVGIHSGVPYGAAQNFVAAIAAMKDGATGSRLPAAGIPLIVFHGDQDLMVNSRNAEQLVSQWLGGPASERTRETSTALAHEGNGRAFTRTCYRDEAGRAAAEHWLVHDGGHAWSGGGTGGSFADAAGPDASREMVRFFAGVSQDAAAAAGRGGLLRRIKERVRTLRA